MRSHLDSLSTLLGRGGTARRGWIIAPGENMSASPRTRAKWRGRNKRSLSGCSEKQLFLFQGNVAGGICGETLDAGTDLPIDVRGTAFQPPRLIVSRWIPIDADRWRIENYRSFLEARRELLAEAANQFPDSLLEGSVPEG